MQLDWISTKARQPDESGLYLTLVGMHTGHYYQYELNEFDVAEQRWLYMEPRERVHFWMLLPEIPAPPKNAKQ